MLSKGSPRNLGGLALSPEKWRCGSPVTDRACAGLDTPGTGAKEVSYRGTEYRGRPEGFGTDGKQSYEVIVPEKVGNRRATGSRVAATIPIGGKDRTGRRIG
jgi:hypothetical protein